jgi:DNA-directed RNA polymerase subunit RPC12/RpoP
MKKEAVCSKCGNPVPSFNLFPRSKNEVILCDRCGRKDMLAELEHFKKTGKIRGI